MTTFPNAPKLVKGGIVLLDPESGAILRVITLQYNPDTMNRTLQIQPFTGGTGGDPNRSEALRLKGPPVETFKLDAEIDATDQLADPDAHANAVAFGIAPQLAVLEALVNPSVDDLLGIASQADRGTLEILPPEAPLTLFVWSKNRVAPVRVAEFSIVEEAFDPALNPIRAKVSLGLHVMSTDDLGFTHRGGTIFLNYLRNRETLAGLTGGASLASLGLSSLP